MQDEQNVVRSFSLRKSVSRNLAPFVLLLWRRWTLIDFLIQLVRRGLNLEFETFLESTWKVAAYLWHKKLKQIGYLKTAGLFFSRHIKIKKELLLWVNYLFQFCSIKQQPLVCWRQVESNKVSNAKMKPVLCNWLKWDNLSYSNFTVVQNGAHWDRIPQRSEVVSSVDTWKNHRDLNSLILLKDYSDICLVACSLMY